MVVSSGYLVTTYNACVERTIYMDYASSRKQINLIEIHFTQLNLETQHQWRLVTQEQGGDQIAHP